MKKLKNIKRLARICAYVSIVSGSIVWLLRPLFLNNLMPLFWSLIIFFSIIYVTSLAVLFAELLFDKDLKDKE